MAEKLLKVNEVAERFGVSSRQVWKLCASGRLPAPVRLARSVRWRECDVSEFIQAGCDMVAFDAQRAAATS